MATKKEIKEHLHIALEEIGKITPWFDEEVTAWIFTHPDYPIEYAGDSPEEVVENYPHYLETFIEERLNDNLNPLTETETKGRGGKREGAGRPKGTVKESKRRLYLPMDIAEWFEHDPSSYQDVRKLMRRKAA